MVGGDWVLVEGVPVAMNGGPPLLPGPSPRTPSESPLEGGGKMILGEGILVADECTAVVVGWLVGAVREPPLRRVRLACRRVGWWGENCWCSIAWWGVDSVDGGCLDSMYRLTARATC